MSDAIRDSALPWAFCALLCASCNAIDSARLSPLPISNPGDDGGVAGAGGGRDAGPPQRDCRGFDELDTCTRDNAVTTCDKGVCLLVQCIEGFVDCDGEADNGCEATLTSMGHCGFCRAQCALANAVASCDSGSCELVECLPGFDDCDGNAVNGCETSLETVKDCGACGTVCGSVENGVPGCVEGTCGVGSCLGPYGDCDDNADNGCEQELVGLVHCGGCGVGCEPANALGSCDVGTCIVESCEGDHRNCNGLPGDGCETTLDTADHCGACGAACELPNTTAFLCDPGAAQRCTVDHGCPDDASSCEDGALENGCKPRYGDCNGDPTDGCEAVLDTLVNCGRCGQACSIPNAVTRCTEAGECVQVGCEPGFGQCTAGGPCVSLADDEANCGECGHACGVGQSCYGGRCTVATCAADRADCDSNGTCETVLTSTSACGLCGLSCGPFPHASAACEARRCAIAACDPGWQDCDGAVHNGCEVNIRTLDTCGSCTTGCFIAGARASCETGTCTFDACNPDRANCNPQGENLADGCETNITLPQSCGACGVDCGALPNVLSGGCSAAKRCEIVCRPGYADCDQNPMNGCESNLTAPGSCGGCNLDCSDLPNVASASCGEQGCRDIVCDPGFADCDGLPGNGCEVNIRTLDNCGECGKACAPAHARASCATGTCTITECDPGYANCDNQSGNGCEAALGSPQTCGSCSNACASGWACTNGKCQCTSDSQCGTHEECCNGECVNTNNVCSWWPCPIASTNRPTVNCDSCNSDCRRVGAQWCCAL